MVTHSRIILLLFLGLLSISASPIIAKSLSSSAIVISFWRMFLASFLLWSYSIYLKGMSTSNRIRTVFSGILLGIHFILFYQAVKTTSISNATLLGTLAPFFTLILEIFILKRKYKKFIYLGMFIALLGTFIILNQDFDLSKESTIGNIYAIFCSLCLGISFLIAEKVRETEGTIQYTRMLYGVAAITILFIGLYNNDIFIINDKYEILGFTFLALVPTILGHNTFYYCIRYTSPTIVATVPLGEPIIASIIAYIIFPDQSITIHTLIGGILSLTGIFMILNYKIDKKVTI